MLSGVRSVQFARLLPVCCVVTLLACGGTGSASEKPATAKAQPAVAKTGGDSKVPHVVFVTGDEEYRSEESMPMLAKILKRDYGFRVSICYSLAEDGTIDPNNVHSISGLEALDTADLMVLFTRFRNLPEAQMEHFLRYVRAGRPVVGFRTATHAFKFPADSPYRDWNDTKIRELVGQKWITHHGHRGHKPLTSVTINEETASHPILRGVEPFQCYSWLYHVHGGTDRLAEGSQPLLTGRSLDSSHQQADRLDRFPLTTPVAWTRTYEGESGNRARVFFTTLGHPYDFKQPGLRRLAINGMLWALGREDTIPEDGADATIEGTYEPNNAGFGQKFKPNRKPEKI